jgi:hypothetical protein
LRLSRQPQQLTKPVRTKTYTDENKVAAVNKVTDRQHHRKIGCMKFDYSFN